VIIEFTQKEEINSNSRLLSVKSGRGKELILLSTLNLWFFDYFCAFL